MTFELYHAERHLGSIVRARGSVYAYLPSGMALGTFSDMDAAAAELTRRLIG